VRKAGNRVRITAQLIDVPTDRHLWSDTFDRELDDIFAIQDEIANAIVNALKAELGIGLQSVNVTAATENLDAYQLYLRGRGLFLARQDLARAIELLDQATRLDPEFAQAWEVLAAVHTVADSWLTTDGIDHQPLAEAAARKALELDPELSMPYAVLGLKLGNRGEFLKSVEHLATAIQNDEKNATARLWRGITLRNLGYLQRAIEDFDHCLAIDPAYQLCRAHKAGALLFLDQTTEALALLDSLIAANFHGTTDEFVSHFVKAGDRRTAYLLAALLTVVGDYAPVRHLVEAIENPGKPNVESEAHWLRFAQARGIDICEMGAVIVAFRWDHCFSSLKIGAFNVIWHPDAAYFRQSPGFRELAREFMLPYWREHGFPPQCRDLGDGDFECD
jgi:tetratricopeptide (TPR) repeat protein